MSSIAVTTTTTTPTTRSTRLARHAAMAATVATAAASWAVVTHLAGVHLGIQLPHAAPSTVALGPTIGAAATTTLFGWAVLALLETRVSRPRRTWVGVAVLVVAGSLGLPIAFATTTSATFGLAAIHLAVAAVAIPLLARTARTQRVAAREPVATARSDA